jgi:SAM-dependent methyltransferase/uncharacterized protein YbaR (Trm112 family)
VTAIDPWFLEHLVCPVDRARVSLSGSHLECSAGHRYPIVEGTPVMLIADAPETIGLAQASLARAAGFGADPRAPELFLESLGISDDEKDALLTLPRTGAVDPVVAFLIAATNGLMYRHLIGSIETYPIPQLRLPPGAGRRLLDIGSSWGRWSLAAAARGYEVVGIDPSLGAVMAAQRAARQVGATPRFLVGDGRHLPFAAGTFDAVYSYSVLQHFSQADAETCAGEIGRVLAAGGVMKVQMPSQFGIRCLYHQARRRFRPARGFEVRYRTLAGLRQLFAPRVGPVRFEADCYFGIGLQPSDAHLMTRPLRLVLGASTLLTRASRTVTALTRVADSVFVEATKTPRPEAGSA